MEEILRMEHITKKFGEFYANKDINLSVLKGEVHTLLGENGAGKSTLMNILFGLAGIGWASINVNSFPMVVELATGSDVGKYTGFYYAASMAAQVVAPVLSGLFLDIIDMKALFPFGAIFVAFSFVTMLFVKHGDSKPIVNKETILDNMGDND